VKSPKQKRIGEESGGKEGRLKKRDWNGGNKVDVKENLQTGGGGGESRGVASVNKGKAVLQRRAAVEWKKKNLEYMTSSETSRKERDQKEERPGKGETTCGAKTDGGLSIQKKSSTALKKRERRATGGTTPSGGGDKGESSGAPLQKEEGPLRSKKTGRLP